MSWSSCRAPIFTAKNAGFFEVKVKSQSEKGKTKKAKAKVGQRRQGQISFRAFVPASSSTSGFSAARDHPLRRRGMAYICRLSRLGGAVYCSNRVASPVVANENGER